MAGWSGVRRRPATSTLQRNSRVGPPAKRATQLEKVAGFYDRGVSDTMASLTSLIEPMPMVFMVVAVGGMVIALHMPMFQVINLVK